MTRIKVFGDHEENTLEQFNCIAQHTEAAALMADGHLGYTMPVGGVGAFDNRVSITGVGVDVSCGNCAIKTDKKIEEFCGISRESVDTNPYRITQNKILNELADQIKQEISFGAGGVNRSDDAPRDLDLFHDDRLWLLPNTGPQLAFRDELIEKARDQLGTVGGGNHYVDVFADEEGYIWVGVHFGSRGFGYTVSESFKALSAGETWGAKVKPHNAIVHLENPIGHDYWHLMEFCGDYTYAGREWVTRKVVSMIGGEELDLVHNNHNFAWKEEHEGRELVVIRKGATPAFPGQRGFVGGSMGDSAVILEGAQDIEEGSKEHWLQKQALFSTVHGAGRVMGRREAKRKVDKKEMQEWLDNEGVIVRGGGLDESPQAYRRLPDVLEAQGETIKVLHTLKPLIVCMASD